MPSSAHSMQSFDVIDTDKGCHITNGLQEHALALHQMLLTQEVINPSDPRRLESLTSPGEVSETFPQCLLEVQLKISWCVGPCVY